jgi:CDP-glucose 4,6-dehydratase
MGKWECTVEKMVMNLEFYKGKKVLVTGHTGFKGSWLSIWLKELGADVIGYSLDPNTERDNFVLSKLNEKIIDIRGDIRDSEKLDKVFEKYEPEIVFHMAAQPLVRLSYENPKETYDVNVMGTLNILEAIRKSRTVKVGIMITTDKCYENKEQIWGYRESDSMGGYDPYSSSKGCCELLISSYRNSFFNPKEFNIHGKAIASVRAGNVIGGGDWAKDRIIPDCIRALESGISIEIRNPFAIRPWQHVLEPISGYLLLAKEIYNQPEKYSGGWNFGPDYNSIINVKNIVENVIKNWGQGSFVDLSNKNEQNYHEAKLLSLDCTKAKTYLKWEPVLNVYDALTLTVEWYKNYSNADVYELCKEQINYFLNL